MTKINNVGGFKNRSQLHIHTFEAFEICEGNRKFRCPSIFVFGIMLNKIWDNVKKDDPFAEQTLIEIEQRITKAFDTLEKLDKKLDNTKAKRKLPDGLCFELNEAIKTSTISFDENSFKTTHAKMFVVLLGLYDSLVRKTKTYTEFGCISKALEWEISRKSATALRSILMTAKSYRQTGVTRSDIINKTTASKEAVEKFGMIPLAILNRQERSEYGPTSQILAHKSHNKT